ncbi:hypothetical protein [Companilactobacillus metriopterae]|uniref:hypothetical protein n=1 Tax=Companilactobacillus metriopterae TaxID=1909267 RepID=UPI00100B92D8|nr:hypothetical protein [Companilactobacillus metriopterae]
MTDQLKKFFDEAEEHIEKVTDHNKFLAIKTQKGTYHFYPDDNSLFLLSVGNEYVRVMYPEHYLETSLF